MLDFCKIATKKLKQGGIQVYPKFLIKKSSDLMIRGGDFYAVWVEDRNLWSTDEEDALNLIDRETKLYAEELQSQEENDVVIPQYLWDAESGMIDKWHKYCQKQMRDSFVPLDEKLIFSNDETKKEDYATKKLPYPLAKGDISAYEELISRLYAPDERRKIEWAIGAIVSGDSKRIQKFLVLYGAAGTGKSTVLNIIQQLFDGYYSVFDAKALGSSSNAFALEAFKSNPLVAIQHDGDLSRIEDNTRLNSLVSHELMTVNEKFKSTYATRFNAFLFMGTNKPVRITDGRSGLIRRLIDVSPTGDKLSGKEYRRTTSQIKFELGAIAQHCLDVYLEDPSYYDNYIPTAMLGASNDFYNFMSDSYYVFKNQGSTTLKAAWEMYKSYCDDARVAYPYSQRIFKEELKNYFREFKERMVLDDGTRVRNWFGGFRSDRFEFSETPEDNDSSSSWNLVFDSTNSIFDKECADCPAQYANGNGTPTKKWENIDTTLKELDTTKLHYVKLPENHIVIDFDIPGEDGKKDFAKNLQEASKWPETYAELSKSGGGIHLHYIYTGDPKQLSRVYKDHIEIKCFMGNSSLRRKLTLCNNHPIATISSGLPLKGEQKVVNFEGVKNEKVIRSMIKKNLNREYHPNTKPSIDFIYHILDQAYTSGVKYDVSDMRNAILAFAASSTNQSEYCIKLVTKMPFKSAEASAPVQNTDSDLIFYDVEVFPNLFLVNWKRQGPGHQVVRMINPTPAEIEELMNYRLVGFNCRRYDNHILYARLMGYTNEQLYRLSQKIVDHKSSDAFFGEAYNVSYTDVYDFCSKKQSLKKWEIELGIHHKELGLPWDQPVPEELWTKVAEYCDNDVIATEAVFDARQADFIAREILADVAGMTVNDTTNSLTTRIIFGTNRHPQDQFNYRDMGYVDSNAKHLDKIEGYDVDPEYTVFDELGRPIFPGYTFEAGKSYYRGEEVGEGGYVYAEPNMYQSIALLDISSMHPSSIIAENLFGDTYTKRFQEIRDARIAIKHKDFEKAKTMLNGALAKYLIDESQASSLAQALKIAINSVYGLTSASFDNPFRDRRNKDNIVAKRGELFMVNLKHEVQRRGFTVAHIKTDSIKIPDATPEIIEFVMAYGRAYGYNFEHEATYDRMCLINGSTYIAKYAHPHDGEWTATAAQFQVPYVFKTLFSKEPIKFEDLCETKTVSTALYLDMNEGMTVQTEIEKELADRKKIRKKEHFDDLSIIWVNPKFEGATDDELREKAATGHKYIFVGRVGQFCPIKPGCGGGILCRENIDKGTGERTYSSANGAKGFRWLESEMVKELGKEDDIDCRYYNKLVDDAVDVISQYGDFEQFVGA